MNGGLQLETQGSPWSEAQEQGHMPEGWKMDIQLNRESDSPFLCLFVLFEPSKHWMMPPIGGLYSAHQFKGQKGRIGTSRSNVSLPVWAPWALPR